jgi:hypothetical protein
MNQDGTIDVNIQTDLLNLYGETSIIGRSLVLHAGEDDGGLKNTDMSHSTGSSGARIACGVIGIEKSEGIVGTKSVLHLMSRVASSSPVVSSEESEDNEINLDGLDEIAKLLPQAVPIFESFYNVLKNVADSTRENKFQLMNILKQLPLNNAIMPEINSTFLNGFFKINSTLQF